MRSKTPGNRVYPLKKTRYKIPSISCLLHLIFIRVTESAMIFLLLIQNKINIYQGFSIQHKNNCRQIMSLYYPLLSISPSYSEWFSIPALLFPINIFLPQNANPYFLICSGEIPCLINSVAYFFWSI